MISYHEASIYWIRLAEHTDIYTQGYVGVSKNVGRRTTEHMRDLSTNTHTNPHLKYAFKKYGWDLFIVDIFFCGEEKYCYTLENSLRPHKNIGWNITIGGHRGPGWISGRKRSAESIKKAKDTRLKRHGDRKVLRETARKQQVEVNRAERKQKNLARQVAHQQEIAQRKLARLQQRQEKKARITEQRQKEKLQAQQEKEKKANLQTTRPICPTCNQRPRAISYIRKQKTMYRSQCGQCLARAQGNLPPTPRWQLNGYKKKPACDKCGFQARYSSQLRVFHVDGNLNNSSLRNLRTVCLNCQIEIDKTDQIWRPGDLTPDA